MDNNFNTPQNNDSNQSVTNNDNINVPPANDPYTQQVNTNPYTQPGNAAYNQPVNNSPYSQPNAGTYTQPNNANPYGQPNNTYTQQPNNNGYSQQGYNQYNQQNVYQTSTPYNTQYNTYQQKSSNDTYAIISLVCGILSLVLCCCCYFLSIVAGIAAIILAIVSKSKSADGKFSGLALGGLICGIIGLAFSIIVIILVFAMGAADTNSWELFEQFLEEM